MNPLDIFQKEAPEVAAAFNAWQAVYLPLLRFTIKNRSGYFHEFPMVLSDKKVEKTG